MKRLLPLIAFFAVACQPTYEHSLVLDNNTAWQLEVMTYSKNPELNDTLLIPRGSETVLFHSISDEKIFSDCLDQLDSAKVKVTWKDFHGDMMDPGQWTDELSDHTST